MDKVGEALEGAGQPNPETPKEEITVEVLDNEAGNQKLVALCQDYLEGKKKWPKGIS